MLGLPKDVVKLAMHSAEWGSCFEVEKRRIASGIADYVIDIQHFGSTAVSRLDAKPIIDIAIAVQALNDADKCENYLNEIGYERHSEIIIEGSIFFTKGNPTTYHVHFTEQGGINLKKWLFFRDQLRDNHELAEDYKQLKRNLEKGFENDRDAYNQGKDGFINKVLEEMK